MISPHMEVRITQDFGKSSQAALGKFFFFFWNITEKKNATTHNNNLDTRTPLSTRHPSPQPLPLTLLNLPNFYVRTLAPENATKKKENFVDIPNE